MTQVGWRISVLAVLALALGSMACSAPDESGRGDVSHAELLAAFEAGTPPLLLDVRTPEEYASGHVPGARNVPIDTLSSQLDELAASRGEPVVVYCERGPRASKAADALTAAGFTSVRRLAGSMAAWREAGLPVE
jgi:rhodanese-related sulfurtransferase